MSAPSYINRESIQESLLLPSCLTLDSRYEDMVNSDWNSAINDAKLEGIGIGTEKVLTLMRQGYTAEQIETMVSAGI